MPVLHNLYLLTTLLRNPDIFMYTNHPFVILIDEWDCLFREYKQNKDAQKKYLDILILVPLLTFFAK